MSYDVGMYVFTCSSVLMLDLYSDRIDWHFANEAGLNLEASFRSVTSAYCLMTATGSFIHA